MHDGHEVPILIILMILLKMNYKLFFSMNLVVALSTFSLNLPFHLTI